VLLVPVIIVKWQLTLLYICDCHLVVFPALPGQPARAVLSPGVLSHVPSLWYGRFCRLTNKGYVSAKGLLPLHSIMFMVMQPCALNRLSCVTRGGQLTG
jgi:hypothetical protein